MRRLVLILLMISMLASFSFSQQRLEPYKFPADEGAKIVKQSLKPKPGFFETNKGFNITWGINLGCQAADIISTYTAINRGLREANPLFVNNRGQIRHGVFFGTKLMFAGVGPLLFKKYSGKKQASIFNITTAAITCPVAVRNFMLDSPR